MSKPIEVAIVDDHTVLREGLRKLFVEDQKKRFEVIGDFGNGSDFLDYLKKKSCDVVVMDIHMPIRGGESTVELIHKKFPDVSVVILTMNTRNYMMEFMVKLGVYAYLPKESGSEEIKNAVLSARDKKMFFNRLLTEEKYKLIKNGRKEPSGLTLREQFITSLVASGLNTAQIAEKINLSPATVSKHREHIMKKTQCSSIAELVTFAYQHQILELTPR